ncbi:hypothetical protein [Marinobacter maroccanus]|nr:hypothetical protein [Marinobacter maroccanus]
MEFRRRHNSYFAMLNAFASHDPVGIVTANDIEVRSWLGIADRDVLRQLPSFSVVLLDITAWRRMILEPYQRLGPGIYMVGVVIDNGVIGAMDKSKPVIRMVRNKKDRLDRSN